MENNLPIISISQLSKTFQVALPANSPLEKIQHLFFPRYQKLIAVDGISFEIKKGERVAFIGPNGAGKSTTIKILTGILYPEGGTVLINGLNPIKHRRQLAYQIGTVIGHRSQLWYHLSAMQSFKLLAAIYEIDQKKLSQTLEELVDLLKLSSFIHSPVKELSLGQRMRCELAASLLHHPPLLFLDEPSIGLDVVSKNALRSFIKMCSVERGTTIFLTSHDTSDIEAICDRAIVIDKGKIIADSSIEEMKKKYINKKMIKIKMDQPMKWPQKKGLLIKKEEAGQTTLEVDLHYLSSSSIIQMIIAETSVLDLTIEDPPLEDMIKQIYCNA